MDSRILKAERLDRKKVIVNKIINSDINVTPSILDFILNLDEPLKIVKLIIKEISFLPNFNSHLTDDILQKISNEELNQALKKFQSIKNHEREFKAESNKKLTYSLNTIKSEKEKREILKITENVSKFKNPIESQKEFLILNKKNKDSRKSVLTNRIKKNLFEGSKSTLAFNPIAKDYEFSFEILKDPTGKIYTNGEYEDFYNLTLDKFNNLRNLMRKRPEVLSANNINSILRLTNKVEVSMIGIVKEIRKTKNGNHFLTLEDITGLINVLIRKDSENQDNVKIAERTLHDQMIYVEGTYNPGERGKNGIVYCNYISKIDIPRDYEPNKSKDPLSIALISDTHIGSKEFEEKLWNRFTALLNGKIGNKNQRERAGKIKYLIINGDLVDGIGVYPNQKDDLIISDIFEQYKKATEILSEIPDYIKIFYSSGNHEPVRNALPRPAVPKKYSKELRNNGVKCIGNPSVVQTHNVNTLVFHGDSIIDINMLIPGLENNKPVETMKELLKCRHLAPIYGKKTQIAPTNKDWLVIDKIPDIFHTGHLHINGMGSYNKILLTNSGCFQSQTDYMKSLGIQPTPGILSIVDLDTLKGIQLDLKTSF